MQKGESMNIAISTYEDYLTIAGKKTCPLCKEEYDKDKEFYPSPFSYNQKICNNCITELYQEMGAI